MKREQMAGLALSAAFLAGCSPDFLQNDTLNPYDLPLEGTISLAGLPETLPPAVAAQRDRMVKIVGYKYLEDGSGTATAGSGIQYDAGHILTAAHVVLHGDGTEKFNCGKTFVFGTSEKPQQFSSAENADLTGAVSPAENIRGKEEVDESGFDGAWMTIKPGKSGGLDERDTVQVRDTPLKEGEAIYMMGFGPDGDGRDRMLDRHPDQRELARDGIDIERSTPRVIGGIVAGTTIEGKSQLFAMTGLADYSEVPEVDKINRKGDSGGAAFDAEGRLVGIISQGKSSLTEQAAEGGIGTHIVDEPQGYRYPVTKLQLVTPDTVNELQGMPAAPCEEAIQ